MTTSVYVYYKVSEMHVTQARHAVMGIFSDIQGSTGLHGRLLRRQHDPMTWMEAYQNVTDITRFEKELSNSAARRGLNSSLLADGSTRTIEIFVEDVLTPKTDNGILCA